MPALLDPERFPQRDAASTFGAARPFPWLVIDDFLDDQTLTRLRHAVAGEPHWPEQDEIVECLASGATLQQPALREFAERLGGADERAALLGITGRHTSHLQLRSYVYPAGGYLLPHTDHRAGAPGAARQVAFVLYLSPPEAFEGGELDLYRCQLEGGEIVATTVETTIAPIANRLVLFEVSDQSLHRVREVTAGARLSLAGWFL